MSRLVSGRGGARKCRECGQPVLRKGQARKHPEDYRHAQGCPLDDYTPARPARPAPKAAAPRASRDGGGR